MSVIPEFILQMRSITPEEVHLWRGSPEQRALRSLAGKFGRFAYFDRELDFPDWTGKKVLDFGGNEGALLLDHDCQISPENYYCLDVISEALAEGRKRFPQAHWFHYNRYNCSFNPQGIKHLPVPDMGVEFDFILAYSVFTHTTREDMHTLLEQLRSRLAAGGALAFTFIDPTYVPWPYRVNNLRFRLEKNHRMIPAGEIDGLLKKSRDADWCALVDGSEIHVNNSGDWSDEARDCLSYNVYYTVDFLRQEFPEATIRPPVNGEMQHCCLMRGAA